MPGERRGLEMSFAGAHLGGGHRYRFVTTHHCPASGALVIDDEHVLTETIVAREVELTTKLSPLLELLVRELVELVCRQLGVARARPLHGLVNSQGVLGERELLLQLEELFGLRVRCTSLLECHL